MDAKKSSSIENRRRPARKFIDANINTISDLIKLIDNNHYDDDYKYNIDLQSLHKIKHELESLNNMVGLETIK